MVVVASITGSQEQVTYVMSDYGWTAGQMDGWMDGQWWMDAILHSGNHRFHLHEKKPMVIRFLEISDYKTTQSQSNMQ